MIYRWRYTIYTVCLFIFMAAVFTNAKAAELKRITDEAVLFSGDFTSNTTEQMKKYLTLNKQTKVVFLKSNGGLVGEGFWLGELFNEKKLNVIVADGDYCLSACAIAFLGGKEQSILGTLGFHNAHIVDPEKTLNIDKVMSQGQLIGGYMLYYTLEMGYNSQLVYLIQSKTDKETFIKFTKKADLDRFFVGQENKDIKLFLKPVLEDLDGSWIKEHVGKIEK